MVNELTKSFKTYNKGKGLLGSLKSLARREQIDIFAISNVSITINKGEIVGLLGLNGAGKTTLIKLLTGILYPTSGQISVLGYNPFDKKKSFLKKIALVTGSKGQLFWDINADDNFELLREIYEIGKDDYEYYLDDITKKLNINHLMKTQIRRLSLGERMKMEITGALMHLPELIFLDEPTLGLDVNAQEELRSFLNHYAKVNNCTIIITSHNLEDIAQMCTRLILINNGGIHYDGLTIDFYNMYAKLKNVEIELKDISKYKGDFCNAHNVKGNRITFNIDNDIVTSTIQQLFEKYTSDIIDVKISEPKLEILLKNILFGRTQ
ncbi:MAG: ATP-binding cassette domain-containing protein [Clostridium sp.]|jgi:ABC-2 type transport system ATP-binding protein|nr:ATP-binding cassette domain-containing protein [Clostridium sp.]